MRIRYGALASVAVLALALTACSSGGNSNSVVTDEAEVEVEEGLVIDGELVADQETYDAAQEQTLTLYTGYQEANQVAFNDAFTEDTGIEVEYVRDVTNKLSERILSENGANQLGADVIITSDYKVAREFDEAGIFEPYTPLPIEEETELQHDDGAFSTFANVAVTFAYNTQLVAEEDVPTSWNDLLDPANAGKIGITSGTAGGSSIALNRFIQEEVDPDYWTKLAALNPTIFDSGGQRQEALARGELNVATAGTAAVNVAATQDNAPIDYVVPDEGLVLFSFFIGKVAEAENSEAAQVFINYALSKRGQSVIAQVGDYGARADVDPPVANGRELPPLDSDQVWVMPAEKELEYGEADAAIWKAAFGK
ncbi:ABC transporter substrate-binding protein [Microbacterium gallinarum]|uniref:Extracellular solute-binding protein n=1 Tax=Microbacterium gallinarum TaxID=2762209 RepID=A0ABR8X0N2_9MICO|nr:extracellular solute-binding protein [Microbacterium gallinarum]MBD8022747.1 extracellular solute-binding protein [Microbacterium gallinarum]